MKVDSFYVETILTLHHNIGTKHSLVIEQSVFLWHKRLGHISRERMERLIKNKILHDLDFMDLNICMDCIKGKHKRKKLQEALKFLKLCILIFVGLLMLILSERKDILSPLFMTIHVTLCLLTA